MYSVKIISKSIEEMRALDKFGLDIRRRTAYKEDENQYSVHGFLSMEQMQRLRHEGYTVNVLADLKRAAREQMLDVSPANRFAEPISLSEAEERKVRGYMTSDEVESLMDHICTQFPDMAEKIQLPEKTWEGRTCHALRMRAGTNQSRTAVLVTGSMHAREWGGSDICSYFSLRLLQAYKDKTQLKYGNKTYSPQQVQSIMENLDIFVFPNVNPDGKEYSQKHDPWWRKNRNTNNVTDDSHKGVDLNRNFDFLWSSGIGSASSTDAEVYKGTAPFSEPESRNVKYMFDTYPNIGFYLDVHSFGGLILYSWGDDNNQHIDQNQNFHNHNYDGKRGMVNDTLYREYIPTPDEAVEVNIANRMSNALSAVRGSRYKVQQAVGLYPTSATSDDYAFSRHLTDPGKKKIYSFVIEFGKDAEEGGEFIPPFSEMQNIIDDVDSALTEFCLAAAGGMHAAAPIRELVGSRA